ncbi:unnamed protein product [Meganyctiphanes norvegica]|uniref:Chitin-binding type-2 domain-containing protein n=1 Tax=Meganyctiphanes norvegica TaxID=48144 RepID=A0AAV2RQE8_MEGNR
MRSTAFVLAAVLATAWSQSCPPDTPENSDLAFFPDREQCDKYVQCKDGVATEELCPNGLLFNDLLQNAAYPCGYPNEVDCGSRGRTQQPEPTENCGNAWGYFGSGDSSQCGYFFNCVAGTEFLFNCPEGLAWSEVTYRCEWPDQAPTCDAAAFLGVQCPAQRDLEAEALFGHLRIASPRNCRQFFICVDQSPRLNACEEGTVYNPDTSGCDEPEAVRGCETHYPREELAAIRERKALAAERVARRQAEFEELKAQLAQRRAAGQL